jgi:hypothetical protein
VDYAILILLGLLYWATKTRRRSVRVVIYSVAAGTAIGAAAYPALMAAFQAIRPAETARPPGVWTTLGWLVDTLRLGSAIGLLAGVFVGFLRILPPRRSRPLPARPRAAAGRSR